MSWLTGPKKLLLQLFHQNKNCASLAYEHSAIGLKFWTLTRKEALAAVTVPCGLIKAAFSLPMASMDEGRIPLSLSTGAATPAAKRKTHSTSWLQHIQTGILEDTQVYSFPMLENGKDVMSVIHESIYHNWFIYYDKKNKKVWINNSDIGDLVIEKNGSDYLKRPIGDKEKVPKEFYDSLPSSIKRYYNK